MLSIGEKMTAASSLFLEGFLLECCLSGTCSKKSE